MQLTWRKAFVAFDAWLKKNHPSAYRDVLKNPELLDTDTDLFMLSGMYFWEINNLNTLADKGDFEGITEKINKKKEGKIKRREIFDELVKF